jgi:hypothetical protein
MGLQKMMLLVEQILIHDKPKKDFQVLAPINNNDEEEQINNFIHLNVMSVTIYKQSNKN